MEHLMNSAKILFFIAVVVHCITIHQVLSQEPFRIDAEYMHHRYIADYQQVYNFGIICDSLHNRAGFSTGFTKIPIRSYQDPSMADAIFQEAIDHGIRLSFLDEGRFELPLFQAIGRGLYRWKYQPEAPYHYKQDSSIVGEVGFESSASKDVDLPQGNTFWNVDTLYHQAGRVVLNRKMKFEQSFIPEPLYMKARIKVMLRTLPFPPEFLCRLEVFDSTADVLVDSVSILASDIQTVYCTETRALSFLNDVSHRYDYRVHWYGKVPMHLDYVAVDNQRADSLFRGLYDQDLYDYLACSNDADVYRNMPWFKLHDEVEGADTVCRARDTANYAAFGYLNKKTKDWFAANWNMALEGMAFTMGVLHEQYLVIARRFMHETGYSKFVTDRYVCECLGTGTAADTLLRTQSQFTTYARLTKHLSDAIKMYGQNVRFWPHIQCVDWIN
jgi:hypothetical protein